MTKTSICLGEEKGDGRDRDFKGVQRYLLCSLIFPIVMVSWVCIHIETYQTAHFKHVQFTVCQLCPSKAISKNFYWLIWGWWGEREREREHCFVVPLPLLCIYSWLILVGTLTEDQTCNLGDALTNWAAWPGQNCFFFLLNIWEDFSEIPPLLRRSNPPKPECPYTFLQGMLIVGALAALYPGHLSGSYLQQPILRDEVTSPCTHRASLLAAYYKSGRCSPATGTHSRHTDHLGSIFCLPMRLGEIGNQ